MKIEKFKKCPLCNSTSFLLSKKSYLNLYSEQISLDLKISQEKLINIFKNLQCNKCKLIYKKNWFDKNFLNKIFNEIVPVHPKGWDTISNKFSKKYFEKKIKSFKLVLKDKKKLLKKNKIQRELISIADSILISTNIAGINKKKLIHAIKNDNIEEINLNYKRLIKEFNYPEEFKRFKGFDSDKLISFIKSKIGKLSSYSELGCPLWGSLEKMNRDKLNCSFIKVEDCQFWGRNCKKKNFYCYKKLNNNIKIYSKIPFNRKKVDYLAVYLFLDHVVDPLMFMKKILKYSYSVGIILEQSTQGVPVQHFTGWNINSMKFLAKKLNKKIDYNFEPIKKTGKDFYLIY